MKMRLWVKILALAALWLPGALFGAETIKGRVAEQNGDTVKITSDSEWLPVAGDPVEIIMEIPGVEGGATVAMGKVTEVAGNAITAKMEKKFGDVKPGQSAKIVSEKPQKKNSQITTGQSAKTVSEKPQSGARGRARESIVGWKVTFGSLPVGPVPANALASAGIASIETPQGTPTIAGPGPEMVLCEGASRILTLTDAGRTTTLILKLTQPVMSFSLTRIGVTGGSSVPPWRLEALDSAGNVVASTGEAKMSMEDHPRQFTVQGAEIIQLRLTTDNRFGDGPLTTYDPLPICEFSMGRIEIERAR